MSNPKHAGHDARATWRANALFRAMSSDYLLREQFATGPAEILADYVLAGRLPLEASESADQLLFSVFSSPSLRRWMGGYARRATAVSRQAFAMDFARAAATSRDELVILALIRGAAEAGGEFAAHADLLRWIIAAMGGGEVSSGTEMSPGGGTEISPGGGTERSPGAVARPELINAALRNAERLSAEILRADSGGTEMSPGGGTEQSPGGGTEMSPGALSLAQRLAAEVRSAVRLSERILRGDAEGTEMSPGGGTEISPGGGTDMSPGRVQREMLLSGVLRSAERLGLDLLRLESGGTEVSPGGGTEVSPGGGTEISPGALRHTATLVAEIRLAARLNDELIRAEGATEMSPGGGTEQSPGGGAEMSPGGSRQLEQLSAGLVNAERLSVALLRAESGGTEMSPGGGTEVSPGGGTEMSPGATRLLERLVAEVRLASRLGAELVRGAASGTEMSPGGGTEISPGGGTEMSPGGTRRAELLGLSLRNAQRLLAQFLRNAQNGTEVSPGGGTEVSPGGGGTEVSPGGGTEVSPGGGTEVSPGAFGLAERLSTELRATVRLGAQILRGFLDGTEMSPGTATEISPGTATEISPGGFGDPGGWGIQLPGHVFAALDALVRYATALRSRGALAVSGLEEG
jgi:hypothetical protein